MYGCQDDVQVYYSFILYIYTLTEQKRKAKLFLRTQVLSVYWQSRKESVWTLKKVYAFFRVWTKV